jgi:CRP/FNR family transcriptional regulator
LTPIKRARPAAGTIGRVNARDPTSVPPCREVHPSAPLRTACSNCSLRELCLPIGLTQDELDQLDGLIAVRRTLPRGQTLFHGGDPFRSLYAVRSGFFKSCVTAPEARQQVTGFQMAGDLLGLDGIGGGVHQGEAVALEDSQVCVIPYAELEVLTRASTNLQRTFHRIMSREIVRDHAAMLLMGGLRAEERLAAFLLNLAQRHKARGFSSSALVLRMTRGEIGSYLGLTLETVSRAFSRLQADGLLEVRQRAVRIVDAAALRRLADAAAA